MKRFLLMAGVLLLSSTVAGSATAPPLFSSFKPGDAIAAPLRLISLPKIPANQFTWVDDNGTTVLQSASRASAATIAVPLTAPAAASTRIGWRWKVDRVLDAADMEKKSGDDFAARFYVFFDAPLDQLPFLERTKIRLIRLIWGEDVPTAVLCYVWDNKHPAGYAHWSPFSGQVRMIVLQGGAGNAGKWMNESRDVSADFKAAFQMEVPAITGIAVGNDTDQTGESVRAWFGDVVMQ